MFWRRSKDRRPAVTLITGFLGSGKTTLLNRLLANTEGFRVGVLVNDFGEVNIDAELVVGVERDKISLANGCICCTIRGDLIRSVNRLLKSKDALDHILVEASGISEPLPIAQTFLKMQAEERLTLDGIVALIDAEGFMDLRPDQRLLAEGQIKVADLIVLNKADLVDEDKLALLRRVVRSSVPSARLFATEQADVPLEILASTRMPADRALPDEDGHHHPERQFETVALSATTPLSLERFQRAMVTLPTWLYRAKGFVELVELPKHRAEFHLVGRRLTVTTSRRWKRGERVSRLVFIGDADGFDAQVLDEALRRSVDTSQT
ncbi:MAG: GTP-binding protein [Deltaproteobacteria bacterium]